MASSSAARSLCAETPEGIGQRDEGLIVERDGPRTAQPLAHVGLGGLEGIVPVAVTVGGEHGAGDDPALDQVQGALDVLHGWSVASAALSSG